MNYYNNCNPFNLVSDKYLFGTLLPYGTINYSREDNVELNIIIEPKNIKQKQKIIESENIKQTESKNIKQTESKNIKQKEEITE